MYKKLISVITSVFLTITPFRVVSSVAVGEEQADNSFSINYNYLDNTVESVLSIDGSVCIGGFDATLNYDADKYTVESSVAINTNVLLNVIPSKGEIVISMASTIDNLSEASDLVSIQFSCLSMPEKSDFSFEISDAYMIDENYDSESVRYSFKENWNGLDDITTATTTATTTAKITTTTTTTKKTTTETQVTASKISSTTSAKTTITNATTTKISSQTTAVSNNKNGFIISINENKDTNSVELSFLTKGNVEFWTAEGSIKVVAYGLEEPSLSSSISDSLSSYKADENSIYFTIVSSTGGNITEEQNIFTYVFPIKDSNYSIACSGIIKDICDQNYNDVSYTITEENNTISSPIITTSATSTATSKPTVTSTTNTTVSKTNTISATTTMTSETNISSTTNTATSETNTASVTATTISETNTSLITDTTAIETSVSTSIKNEMNVSPYEFSNWAKNDYYQKTGIEPYISEYIENSDGTLSINLLDEHGILLDTYTIHSKTGVGFDIEGNEVNLPQTGNNSLINIFIIAGSLTVIIAGAYIIYISGVIKRKKNEN